MARYKAEDFYPEAAAWAAIEADLRAQGKTNEEIEEIAAYLRDVDFAKSNDNFRALGLSEEEIVAFWDAMVPKDGPDSVDEVA